MWTMALNNFSILNVNIKFKMTKKNNIKSSTAVFKSSNHTIIVDAEFLVLACASNLHLVHRPAPPALAMNTCNVGAR